MSKNRVSAFGSYQGKSYQPNSVPAGQAIPVGQAISIGVAQPASGSNGQASYQPPTSQPSQNVAPPPPAKND